MFILLAGTPENCTVSGYISTTGGTKLIGATVLILGSNFGAMTGYDGEYCITDIPPGVYEITARMVGMSDVEEVLVLLNDGDSVRVDFSMAPLGAEPLPLRDTVMTTLITQTAWKDIWADPENFYFSEGIDFFRFPGELRLSPLNNLIPFGYSILGSLNSYHTGWPTALGDNFRTPHFDLIASIDIENNGVREYIVASEEKGLILLLRRFRAKRDFTVMFARVPGSREIVDIMYSDSYHPYLVCDSVLSPVAIAVEDLDHDGLDEILVGSSVNDAITAIKWSYPKPVSFNSELRWHMNCIQDSTFNLRAMRVADMNLDGWPDIVAAGDSMIGLWLNSSNGDLDFAYTALPSSRRGYMNLGLVDLDDDQDLDVIASARNGISFCRNDDDGKEWREVHLYRNGMDESYVVSDHVHMDADSGIYISFEEADESMEWFRPYVYEGSLVSKLFPIASNLICARLEWDIEYMDDLNSPNVTSVGFRVRSVSRSHDYKPWSPILTEPCEITSFIEQGDRYLQYEVLLRTENQYFTPILREVTIEYTYPDYVRESRD